MGIQFDRIRAFPEKGPELAQALSQFEQSVADSLKLVSQRLDAPNAVPPGIIASSGKTALPNQLTRVSTAAGDVELFLPRPDSFGGKSFRIVKMVGAHTLTLRPVTGSINGGASLAVTAAGLRVIECDGAGYWA